MSLGVVKTLPLWTEKETGCARWVWIVGTGVLLFFVGLVVFGLWGDAAVTYAITHAPWVMDHRGLVQTVSDWGLFVFYAFFLGALGFSFVQELPWAQSVVLGWLWAELVGAFLAVQFIKYLAGRVRPDEALSMGGGDHWVGPTLRAAYHSFPSGHTADVFISAAFVVLLVRSPWVGCLAWIGAILVALSRIALAKHYLSDVLAGLLLAQFFTLLVIRRRLL